MRLSTAIKRAMTSQTTEGELPSYEGLLDEYGSNRGIANAAGVTNPKSKESRALMRNLQRYAKGRAPMPTTLHDLAEELGRRPGELLSLSDVVARMRESGLHITTLKATITISKDTRQRTITAFNPTSPDQLEEEGEAGSPSFADSVADRHWAAAAEVFGPLFLRDSYGIAERATVDSVETLEVAL